MKISSDNDKVYKGFMRDKKLQEVKLMHELAAKCADMIKKHKKYVCLAEQVYPQMPESPISVGQRDCIARPV